MKKKNKKKKSTNEQEFVEEIDIINKQITDVDIQKNKNLSNMKIEILKQDIIDLLIKME